MLILADRFLSFLVLDEDEDFSLEDYVQVFGDGSLFEDDSGRGKALVGEALDQLQELLMKVSFEKFLEEAQVFEFIHQVLEIVIVFFLGSLF